jgi:hypothetical protein
MACISWLAVWVNAVGGMPVCNCFYERGALWFATTCWFASFSTALATTAPPTPLDAAGWRSWTFDVVIIVVIRIIVV